MCVCLYMCEGLSIHGHVLFVLFNSHPRIFFIDFREKADRERKRERERQRERNIEVREKHRSVASHMYPNGELKPQRRYVP